MTSIDPHLPPPSADAAGLAELARQHIDLVHSTALAQLHDPHLADDATQAVFLLLVRKAPHLPPGTLIPGWLFKTTCHVVSEIRRQNARRQRRERESAMPASPNSPSDSIPAPADDAMAQEDRAALHQAIARLPGDDRNAIVLHYFQGHSASQVAAALQTSDTAARIRLSRARERLRALLRRAGITLSAAALAATLETSQAHAAPAATFLQIQTLLQGAAPAAKIQALVHGVHMALRTKQIVLASALIVLACGIGFLVIQFLPVQPPSKSMTAIGSGDPDGAAVTSTAAATRGPGLADLSNLPILSIEVRGNVPSDAGIILAQVRSKIGQNYARDQVDADVRNVAALNRFKTVRAEVIYVENTQTPPSIRGVDIRYIVEEIDAASPQAPKDAVLAAYRAALSGNEADFLTHFGARSDDGKPLPPTAAQQDVLRAVVRGMHAFELLTAAVGEKFGPDVQDRLARQIPTYVDPADVENAVVQQVDADHATVDMGKSGPGKVPVLRVNGTWLVDASVLATLNETSVRRVDAQIDQINALTSAVKAGQFPDAQSFQQTISQALKGMQ